MKSCPACHRTYADETLNYCLVDGSSLSAPYEPEVTQRLPPTRSTAPDNPGTWPAASVPQAGRQTNNSAFKYIVTALLALIAGVGIMLWLNSRSKEADSNNSQNSSSATQASNANTPGRGQRPSLGITATASSSRSPESGITYVPDNVLDQSLATAWVEGVSGPGIGEWVRCDFDREVKLNRIIITPGYFKTPELWRQNNRLAGATFYFSDGSSRQLTFPDRMVEQRLEVGGVRTRWVRMVIDDFYPGSVDLEDTPVSNLAFDWE